MKNVISLRNISFGYEEGLVLDNVSLDISEGDYLGIVGPNGSGKSTLLKLMLGILAPVKGEIEILGKDIKSFRGWGKIGYVPQKATSFNTSFPATVEEVVGANLYSKIGLFKPIKREYFDKIYEALEIVGMEQLGKRLVGNLSGGQQQKIFIARALVSSPQIIFLDEPTVGIDAKSQEEFFKLLSKLNNDMNITIVMISHDIGVITEKAGKVACVGNGKVIIHSNFSDIQSNKVLSQFYGDNMRILTHAH